MDEQPLLRVNSALQITNAASDSTTACSNPYHHRQQQQHQQHTSRSRPTPNTLTILVTSTPKTSSAPYRDEIPNAAQCRVAKRVVGKSIMTGVTAGSATPRKGIGMPRRGKER
ncbi:hypothetical protein PILCRDRAFT_9535 [Piloderma croceum F 1598]|uniref:Uncharacterized protein n=1 Tax=Piloderma croceum (strain F 1598) TaxID=765440 RepID=A0A0C3FLG0_PILCF|nr:hypothetical protein PILCRDRAFT_9535 [Piloderma croceum F 1598]